MQFLPVSPQLLFLWLCMLLLLLRAIWFMRCQSVILRGYKQPDFSVHKTGILLEKVTKHFQMLAINVVSGFSFKEHSMKEDPLSCKLKTAETMVIQSD